MAEKKAGCAKPTGKSLGPSTQNETIITEPTEQGAKPMSKVKVGGPAPDFVAPAYHKGGFTEVKLSEYFGKWIVLCFYPGDFTFV